MIKGNALYPLNKHCSDLGHMCCKNINRILECIEDHPHCSSELCKFTKCCLVMEKLCECISCCCCNKDCVGSGLMSEFKQHCTTMTKCCETLQKKLSKEKAYYIKCNKIIKMCKDKKHTRKRRK